MILFASGRCDMSFYLSWFMNRYKEGFLDVRNPFNKHLVSRIYFEDVDAILFCTKNPIPFVDKLKLINKPIIFHVTLTPYKSEIEPNVLDKNEVIKGIKEISNLIGPENVYLRYDPIFISNTYTLEYHKKAFKKMTELLDGYVKHIIVSFIDDYKNVRKNMFILNYKTFTQEDYKEIGTSFSKYAQLHGMTVQTCFEDENLLEYGFIKGDCMGEELAYNLTGKHFKRWHARKEKKCECVELVDIGVYNTCKHFCKYCYANFDEKQVLDNIKNHNPNSSLLIGELLDDDVIKRRK